MVKKISVPQIPGKKAVQQSIKENQQMYRNTVSHYIQDSTFRNFYRHMANIKRKAFYENRVFKPLNSKEWHKRFVMNFFQLPAVWKPMTSKELESAAYKNKIIMCEVFGAPTTSFTFMSQPSPMFQLPPPRTYDQDFEFFMPIGHQIRLKEPEVPAFMTLEYLREEMLIIQGISDLETHNEIVAVEKIEARDMTEIEAISAMNKAAEDEENDKTAVLEDQKKTVLLEKAEAEIIQREEFIARDVEIAEDEGLQILAAAFAAFVAEPQEPKEPKASPPPNPPRPSLFIKIPEVPKMGKYSCSHCNKAGHTRAACKDYKAMKEAEAAEAAAPKKKYSCSYCKFGGHTRAKCKDYKAYKASFNPANDTEEE
jgi:hypothetical protein